MAEVADRLGCSGMTVQKWIHRHDIRITDPRGRGVKGRRVVGFPATFTTDWSGSENVMYEVWVDDNRQVRVHRLLAVAEFGFDAVADCDVHHINGIGWDNRPENIEVLTRSEHSALHNGTSNRGEKDE